MTRILQSDLEKLLRAAVKLLPTKAALKDARFVLKEKKYVAGQGRVWLEIIPVRFRGVLLEAHADGFITATVHTLDGKQEAVVSLPLKARANVDSPFRIMVYGDTMHELVKLSPKKEAVTLRLIDDRARLEMVSGPYIDRLNPIKDDWFIELMDAPAGAVA